MSTDRPRWLAVALAISMLTVGLSMVPSTGAQSESCTASYTDFTEEGYVMLANPDQEPNRRVSRATTHFVFAGGGTGDDLGRRVTNGIDAYVFDLGCLTSTNSQVCIQRSTTQGSISDGLEIFDFRGSQATAPDIRIAFYDNDAEHMDGENWNPDVPPLPDNLNNDGDLICLPGQNSSGDVPTGAQFAVVFLTEGNPAGIQYTSQPAGPYTSHFNLYYCLDATFQSDLTTTCDDILPSD